MLIEKGGKIMKNSKWKRISSMGIVAVIVLATGMSGCASENSQSSQTSQTSEGTTTELTEMWENQKKMQEIIDSTSDSNKEVLNKGSVMEVVDLDELDVPFTLEFKTDGTYALKSDTEQFEQKYEEVITRYEDAIKAKIKDTLEASKEDEGYESLKAWAEDAGYASTEEMINDNLEVNKANKLQQFETLFTEQEREGKYEEKEGKLYLSNSTTEAVNEETDFYADYEIKDGQLTLKNESETEVYSKK